MAFRLTRVIGGPEPNRSTVSRATAIAEQLSQECSILLELYRKKESLTTDVLMDDGRLVSVPPTSSQLDIRDTLWCLHSALLQCRSLLERAIAREEEELSSRNGATMASLCSPFWAFSCHHRSNAAPMFPLVLDRSTSAFLLAVAFPPKKTGF